MFKFNIEKHIPPPKGAGRRLKYPWDQMEEGDSFYFEGKRSSVVNAGNSYLERHDPSLRAASEVEGKGYRIWFVKKDTDA